MGDFVKALGRLANRDIPYIVGGASVILSFLHLFDRLSILANSSTPVVLLFVGIAYVVGYTIQDALSLTPLICSSIIIKPKKFIKWLYKKWARTEWIVDQDFDMNREYTRMYHCLNSEQSAAIERIVFLKTIGNAMGANSFVSSIFLGIKSFNDPTSFNLSLAVAVFAISIMLILLGWLQGLEAVRALFVLHELLSLNPEKSSRDKRISKVKPNKGS